MTVDITPDEAAVILRALTMASYPARVAWSYEDRNATESIQLKIARAWQQEKHDKSRQQD